VITFPYLNKYLQAHGTFWVYAAICVAGFIFILAKLPETKGRSLEEIEKQILRKKSNKQATIIN
jgi:hypothetical protein